MTYVCVCGHNYSDHVDTIGAGGEHFMVCDADEDCPCIDYDEEH